MCLLLALALFCAGASSVLTPKRYDYGATWGMYLEEPKHSVDALFLGTSVVYCDLVPAVIYEETGITSYLMAGPDQTMPVTYRYLRESCKTQSPKAVFIEATALFYEKTNRSLKINLAYMPWSAERIIPTLEEAEAKDRAGLLFPLYAYHSRWEELTVQDWWQGLFGYEKDPLAGYTFLSRVSPVKNPILEAEGEQEENYRRNLSYLGKMVGFCREQGIVPVIFLVPALSRPNAEQLQKMAKDIESLGAVFWDFSGAAESLELEDSADYFDALHLNYLGAEKLSRQIAREMEGLEIPWSKGKEAELWQARVNHFASLRQKAGANPAP